MVQSWSGTPNLESSCPTCGGPALWLASLNGPSGETSYYELVRCAKCGLRERMSIEFRRAAVLAKHGRGRAKQAARAAARVTTY